MRRDYEPRDVLRAFLFLLPARKVRKLDSPNLQFRRTRRPANYIHVARIVRINPLAGVQIRSGAKRWRRRGDTRGENRAGCLIRIYIRYVIFSRRNYVLIIRAADFPLCVVGWAGITLVRIDRKACRANRRRAIFASEFSQLALQLWDFSTSSSRRALSRLPVLFCLFASFINFSVVARKKAVEMEGRKRDTDVEVGERERSRATRARRGKKIGKSECRWRGEGGNGREETLASHRSPSEKRRKGAFLRRSRPTVGFTAATLALLHFTPAHSEH